MRRMKKLRTLARHGRLWELLWLVLVLGSFSKRSLATQKPESKTRSEFEFLLQKPGTLEDFEVKFKKMDEIRASAESALADLLRQRPNNLELQLRMAELNLQKARDVEHYSLELEFSGQHALSQKMKAQYRELCQRGLQLHEKLLKQHANHPLASEIYLGMARTRLGLGDKARALQDAQSGIQAFREASPKVLLNLWVVKGDASFALSRPADALASYEEAQKISEKIHEDSAYVVYKMAWSHFNLKNPERAVAYLDQLLSANDDKLALKKEAVQDFSLFVVDLGPAELETRGGVAGIFDYLAKKSGQEAAERAFDGLGKNYSKNGRRELALKTYETLIARNSVDPKNLERAMLIVEWNQSLANKWTLTEKYRWLLGNYGPQSAWYRAQSQRPDVQKRAYDSIEASLRKFAMGLHQDAVKETVAEIRDQREKTVAQLYDDYLAVFSEEPRIHYYRAEIHRRQKEWARAGEQYDRYLLLSASLPNDKLSDLDRKQRDDAAWGSIQVWSQAIDGDAKMVPRMLKSSDYFVENFPHHPMAPQVSLDAARVELKQKNSAVALKRIEALFKQYPRTKEASEGVHAALDILNEEKDYVNLAVKTRLFLDHLEAWALPGERERQRQDLTEILSKTEARACEILGQSPGREIEAAVCFESYARSFKDHPLASKSLMVASELNTKMGRNDAAIANLENLVRNYPNSESAPAAFSKIALAYEKGFEFTKAAEIFEILLRRNEKMAEKSKIALRLLVLLEGLGEEKKLESLLSEKFIDAQVKKDFFERRAFRYLSALEKAELEGGLEKGKFKNPEHVAALAELGKIEKLLPLEASLRLARIRGVVLRSQNKIDQADVIWNAALKEYWKSSSKRDPRVLEAAARLRLEEASVWEASFRKTTFAKNGARKTEGYGKLENWYSEVVSMKSPAVALEALLRSAKLATEFSDELQAYLPKAPAGDRPTLEGVIGELKSKSEMLIGQVAERAKAWKILSPAVVEAMSLKSAFAAQSTLSHPWGPLTLWADLDEEQRQWSEWSDSESTLRSQLKDRRGRSANRRAALVLVARGASLRDAELMSWSQMLNDKAAVQIRIQALIKDQMLRLSQVYIDQYRSLFGDDNFVPYALGLQAWAEGNAEEAFRAWVSTVKHDDFRLAFVRAAWTQGLAQKALDHQEFKALQSLAKNVSEQHQLAKVCIDKKLSCDDNEVFEKVLATPAEAPFQKDFVWSTFAYRQQAYYVSVIDGVKNAKTMGELENHYRRTQIFYALRHTAVGANQENVIRAFGEIKALVEARSAQLRSNKDRIIAGSLTEGGD